MKTTRWFSGNEKPGKTGVYRRKSPFTELKGWSRWSVEKQRWFMFAESWETANQEAEVSNYQNWPWQGLTTKDGK